MWICYQWRRQDFRFGGAVAPNDKGVWGSVVSSPIGVWGGAPEADAIFNSIFFNAIHFIDPKQQTTKQDKSSNQM